MTRLLAEFVHDEGLDLTAPAVERTAVRGIVRRGSHLLLLGSRHGDYKFPGGGVEAGETLPAALRRELLEECGLSTVVIGAHFGWTIEHLRAAEPEYEVFTMTSHYFLCTTAQESLAAQRLEDYERELQLEPRWTEVTMALATNRAVRARGTGVMRWLDRETRVLALVQRELPG